MKTTETKPVVDLLQRLVQEMIAHPQHLKMEHRSLTMSMIITIQAHAADTPRLIGEGAANYRALVALATAMGAQTGVRITIPPIKEPIFGLPERYRFKAQAEWPRDRILSLLREVLAAVFSFPDEIRCVEDDDDENTITTVEVFVSRMERAEVLDALAPAIRRIFDAIGRANGRLLAVDVMTDTDPAQPATADGRHSSTLPRR